MRNPANAIYFGVNETIQMLLSQKKKIQSIKKMRRLRYQFINTQLEKLKKPSRKIASVMDDSSSSENDVSKSSSQVRGVIQDLKLNFEGEASNINDRVMIDKKARMEMPKN